MSAPARNYWRSLEELADSPGFAALVEREAPRFRDVLGTHDRRRFLQLMASSLALAGVSGCGPEPDPRQLLPYVEQPEGVIAGRGRYFATATTLDGYATGVLVFQQTGRPVKVEGNPDHPASLGAASAIMQASILSLYDPRRAQTISGHGQVTAWENFVSALYARRQPLMARHGDGLRILTGASSSPSLAAQLSKLQKTFPAMRWHQWEPLTRDNEKMAAQQAFGRSVDYLFDVKAADVIFAIESDLISSTPGWLAYARQFASRRRPAESDGKMSRLYAIESAPTLIGAKADHRLPMRPDELAGALRILAAAVGAGPQEWSHIETPHASWLKAAAADLTQHKGSALVHAGREQSTEIHLLTTAINQALGAFGKTIHPIEPILTDAGAQSGSIADLVKDMADGKVDTLMLFDTNPVYSCPPDLAFAQALRRVPFSASFTLYGDETAQATTWTLPGAHEFEAWNDARAFDGTITIQQPQTKPLYGGRTAQQALAILQGETSPDDYVLLRAYWQGRAQNENRGDFDSFWRESLRKGVVSETAAKPAQVTPRSDLLAGMQAPPSKVDTRRLQALFRPDEGLWDGRFADNAWLLEMVRPFTRLTWDNAALIAPETAKRLGVANEDLVEFRTKAGTLTLPVFVLPGQAPDCVTLPLGWGRGAGGLGQGAGFDVYRLRSSSEPWLADVLGFRKTGGVYSLATTQSQDHVQGRDLVREGTLAEFVNNPSSLKKQENSSETLYPPYEYPDRAWAMAIDLNSCIGCQACTIACQAENNVPVVGKDQVLDSRIMHWLRIDRYYSGQPENPNVSFEPIPCMHCENAPCEVVCPVHATVHDHEGLNVMVYNRCVGTRFCSNNCPYKVRRFNFYSYTSASQNDRLPESWNPDVTVRDRGVMEKCTYCIQRIREADIAADRDDRKIQDGEVVTACQQSCPTQAIVFGDKNDRNSAVARRKSTPLDYALLDELNTRPRTTYSAAIRNPNPAIKSDQS